jgi:hypothetical protein
MISFKYEWEHEYVAAILETDDGKLVARIAAAESKMLVRVDQLNLSHVDAQEERLYLATVLLG